MSSRRSGRVRDRKGDDDHLGRKNGEVSSSKAPKKEGGKSAFVIRALASFAMSAFCIALIRAGHTFVIVTGILVQIECFREMVNVRYKEGGAAMPLFRTLQWSWFFVSLMATHGQSMDDWFNEREELSSLAKYTKYIALISFIAYCVVMMGTVMTFKKHLLKLQFQQIMWTLLTICLVVFQFKSFTTNVLHGLFWWAYPALLVIANDVSAYLVGKSCGGHFFKSTFWELSPNKTWEGFIGAGLFTMVVAFFLPLLLGNMSWFTCPAPPPTGMGFNPFPEPLFCEPAAIFVTVPYAVPAILRQLSYNMVPTRVSLMPMQLHGLLYGLFASIVAPFGGFMASAIKRAYNIKDFESVIPGHGGLMDRMDCQLVMIVFTFLHHLTFVAKDPSVAEKLFRRAASLDLEAQQILLAKLQVLVGAS